MWLVGHMSVPPLMYIFINLYREVPYLCSLPVWGTNYVMNIWCKWFIFILYFSCSKVSGGLSDMKWCFREKPCALDIIHQSKYNMLTKTNLEEESFSPWARGLNHRNWLHDLTRHVYNICLFWKYLRQLKIPNYISPIGNPCKVHTNLQNERKKMHS